jgi:RHS repeat-associated protein
MRYGTRNELLATVNENQTLTDNRAYDRAGRLARTDINGNVSVVTYGYDELSRPLSRTGQSWTYDVGGRMLTFDDDLASVTSSKTGVLGYSYDGLNRVRETQASLDGDPTNGITTYAYDAAGRVLQSGTTFYEYDTYGRPTFIKYGPVKVGEHGYDSLGRPNTFKRYDNGVAVTTSTTTYDAAQRTQGIQTTKISTGVSLSNFTYTYDRASRPKTATEQTTGSGSVVGAMWSVDRSYEYDLVGRLTREGTVTTSGTFSSLDAKEYSYDAVGNRTGIWDMKGGNIQSRSYNAANQVIGWSYDAAGRLMSDGSATYLFDSLDRMYRVVKGGVTTTMTYHGEQMLAKYANNLRTFSYMHDTVTGAHSSLKRSYDWRNTAGAIATSYVYDLGGQPIWSELVDYGTTPSTVSQSFLLEDRLGTVRQVYNPDTAAPNRQDGDAWGVATTAQVSAMRFTGEYSDTEFGLVYLRARWYNPANSTFLTRDPFGGRANQPASKHPYQYTWNAPTVYTDPSGRDPWWNEENPFNELDMFEYELHALCTANVTGWIVNIEATYDETRVANQASGDMVSKKMAARLESHGGGQVATGATTTIRGDGSGSWTPPAGGLGGSVSIGGDQSWEKTISLPAVEEVYGTYAATTMIQAAKEIGMVGEAYSSVTVFLMQYRVRMMNLDNQKSYDYLAIDIGYQVCQPMCWPHSTTIVPSYENLIGKNRTPYPFPHGKDVVLESARPDQIGKIINDFPDMIRPSGLGQTRPTQHRTLTNYKP